MNLGIPSSQKGQWTEQKQLELLVFPFNFGFPSLRFASRFAPRLASDGGDGGGEGDGGGLRV